MKLITIDEACELASTLSGKCVTTSNITYLIQYGHISKYERLIDQNELESYYQNLAKTQAEIWQNKNLNWRLSFSEYKEAQTTKHVHRLHPYKGKFIL